MAEGLPPVKGMQGPASQVIMVKESWSQMGKRLLAESKTYLKGPGPKAALRTYRWVLASIVVALLLGVGHWAYWAANSDSAVGLEAKRTVTREGFTINQDFSGFAPGDTLTLRGRVEQVTVIENISDDKPDPFFYEKPDPQYSGLRAIKVDNPYRPVYVGSYNTDGEPLDVVLAGDRALVADGKQGLLILNISTPANLTFDDSFPTPGNASGITLVGDQALIAAQKRGLQAFNLAEPPSKPSNVYRYIKEGEVWDSKVVDSMAFVANGSAGLTIVNLTNSTAPEVSKLDLPGVAVSLALAGDFAYLATGSAGIQIVNISNLTQPLLAGSLLTPGPASEIVIVDQTAYVAAGEAGLLIYDLNDPTSPTLLTAFDTPGETLSVAIDGNVGYLADGSAGLRILDVTNPNSVLAVAQVPLNGAAVKVALQGDYAFVLDKDTSHHFSFVSEMGFPFDFITADHTLLQMEGFNFLAPGNLSDTYFENDLLVVDLRYRLNESQVTGFVDAPYNLSFANLTLTYGYFEATHISLSAEVDHYFFWAEALALLAGLSMTVATSPRVRQELKGASKVARFEIINKFRSPLRTLIVILMLAFFVVGTAWGVAGRVGVTQEGDAFYVENADQALILVTHFTFFILSLFTLVSGFNIIVQERLSNTLNLLLCRPLNRPGILLGKLAGLQAYIGLPALVATSLAVWIIRHRAGEWPATGAAVGYVVLTQVMIFTFLALQANLSVNSRSPTTSAFMGIGMWVTFALLWSLFRLAVAFAMGLGVSDPDLESNPAFQALAGRMAMLNPGEVYDFTVGLLFPRGANDNIEGIPRWAPPVAMLVWASGLLWLASWRFSREKRG